MIGNHIMRTGCCAFAICGGMALAAPPPGYRLVWQDEFDGTALDTAKWQYRTDTRYWSTQLPANVSVSNGLLNLHLKKEAVGSVNYTAGGVISRNLVRYGYYEALMKVPPGGGWQTSFWMMKYNRPATDTVAIELDVIENDSVTPLKYGVNVHRHLPLPHTTFGTKTVNTPSLSASFHLLGCEFTPTTIKYFFEGTLVQTVDASQFPHNDLNIWLTSIAAPLGGTTSVDDSQLPAVAQYDYVRFYEPFPAPSVSITSPTSSAVTLADPSAMLRLEANVTAQSGPAAVVFTHPSQPSGNAVFPEPGTYQIKLSGSNPLGTVERMLAVEVVPPDPAVFSDWQQITWPGSSDADTIGSGADPDHDALNNLLEWALHLDATAPDTFKPVFTQISATLQYTYTRRKTAPGEAAFTVQWCDTLAAPWTPAVSGPPTSLDATRESVHTAIPAGPNGRRFVRVQVVADPSRLLSLVPA